MLKFDKFILESENFKVDDDSITLIGNHLESLILKNKILSEKYLNSEHLEDEEFRHDWEIGAEYINYFSLEFYFYLDINVNCQIDDILDNIEKFKIFLKELKKVFTGLEIMHINNTITDESCITINIKHNDIKTNKLLNNLFKSSKGISKYNL